jgi:hypothetical protein
MKESPKDGDGGQTAPKQRYTTPLTLQEVSEAFSQSEKYGPILTLHLAAELIHVAPSTLKRHVSEGRFKGAVRRGKRLLFWRDRLVVQAMSKQ